MTFISYAQNREDVLLWRALGHVKNGFYIDVGANDPVHDSVTRAFYERGWWGINIEPVPSLHRSLAEQRPRDINLGLAAGAAEAEITLFDLPEVNGWATANPEVAAAHRADGHQVVESRVQVRTLAVICAEHARGDIHFLKVDVEGFEEEVLRGMDFARWRPWVLVVEATLPNSRETNHAQWEALVTAHAYQFAWFDGLNRYYVADEHPELRAALSIAPNVFDDFIPAQLDKAWNQLTSLSKLHEQSLIDLNQSHDQLARAEDAAARHQRDLVAAMAGALEAMHSANDALQQVAVLEQRAGHAEHELASLRQLYAHEHQELAAARTAHTEATAWAKQVEHQLLLTYASRWWRLGAPLRFVIEGVRKATPRALLRRTVMWAMQRPQLRQLALRLMRRFPSLAAAARGHVKALVNPAPAPVVAQYVPPPHLANLPVSARKVLHDLTQERQANLAGTP